MSKKGINILQNILIVLLSVSGVVLFIRLQLDSQPGSFFSKLMGTGPISSAASEETPESLTSLETPVRVAVSGTYGRYGAIHLTNTSDDFAPIRNLLQEALGSAGPLSACTERDLRTALDGTSVYCDWIVPLPLSVVSGMVGTAAADAVSPVRRMVLSSDGELVTLFLTDDETYLCCSTKVSTESLPEVIAGVRLSSVAFAYELADTATEPYTLLPTGELPSYPLLTSASGTQQPDQLLSVLGFNPNTNSRYTEFNGTEVVRDNERTLRIEPNSTLLYNSGGERIPELSATTTDGIVTAADAILSSYRVLSGLISDSSAQLCLQNVQATPQGWLVTFDYQVNGILLRLSSGEHAATAEVDASGITNFSLQLRRYSAADDSALLLPLRQALAIAAAKDDGELTICYVDSSGYASAAWLEE